MKSRPANRSEVTNSRPLSWQPSGSLSVAVLDDPAKDLAGHLDGGKSGTGTSGSAINSKTLARRPSGTFEVSGESAAATKHSVSDLIGHLSKSIPSFGVTNLPMNNSAINSRQLSRQRSGSSDPAGPQGDLEKTSGKSGSNCVNQPENSSGPVVTCASKNSSGINSMSRHQSGSFDNSVPLVNSKSYSNDISEGSSPSGQRAKLVRGTKINSVRGSGECDSSHVPTGTAIDSAINARQLNRRQSGSFDACDLERSNGKSGSNSVNQAENSSGPVMTHTSRNRSVIEEKFTNSLGNDPSPGVKDESVPDPNSRQLSRQQSGPKPPPLPPPLVKKKPMPPPRSSMTRLTTVSKPDLSPPSPKVSRVAGSGGEGEPKSSPKKSILHTTSPSDASKALDNLIHNPNSGKNSFKSSTLKKKVKFHPELDSNENGVVSKDPLDMLISPKIVSRVSRCPRQHFIS